jgi:hypothetical protein
VLGYGFGGGSLNAEQTLQVARTLGFRITFDGLALELVATSADITDAPPQWLIAAVKANGAEITALLKAGDQQAPPPPPGVDNPPPPHGHNKRDRATLRFEKVVAEHYAEEARNGAIHLSMTGGYAKRIRPWGGGMASLFRDGWYLGGVKVTDPETIQCLDRPPKKR